jgi:hypothetical protein
MDMIKIFWPLIPLGLMFAGTVYYPLFLIGFAWWVGFLLWCLGSGLVRE